MLILLLILAVGVALLAFRLLGKGIAVALIVAFLGLTIVAAPAQARDTTWGCPGCIRVGK